MLKEFFEKISEKPEKLAEALSGLAKDPMTFVVLAVLLIAVIALFRMRKIQFTAKLMSQIGLAVALAVVLNMFTIYRMPMGGSVTLASMVPIFLIGFAYGPEAGMLTGFIFGIIDMLLGAGIYHPMQVILDYPLPFMFVGLSGAFPKHANAGMLIGSLARLMCHFLSGFIFFGEYAPQGTHPVIYSLTYNGSFLLADLFIAMLVMNIIPVRKLVKMLNPKAPEVNMW